jgi:hypothetical protein
MSSEAPHTDLPPSSRGALLLYLFSGSNIFMAMCELTLSLNAAAVTRDSLRQRWQARHETRTT